MHLFYMNVWECFLEGAYQTVTMLVVNARLLMEKRQLIGMVVGVGGGGEGWWWRWWRWRWWCWW